MTTLIIATRNAHKVQEIRAILGENLDYLTLSDFPNAPAVVEDAGSFAGNATKKAAQLARWISNSRITHGASRINLPAFVLADDSGLEVDALNGAPGVHSARFATNGGAANSSDVANNTKLLGLLQNVPTEKRAARFRCVLALTPVLEPAAGTASPVCSADEFELNTELFDGTCEGRIGFSPSGQGGFGYDPLFIPGGHQQTFAELGESVKNQLSHRAKALLKLKIRLHARSVG
ncbi:MAG: non-canonical purine NTP pyrophosphatase [Verrucomicrobia bacterium]|nr:non-canonical purine NTP pyrophosphatase [Verrucomicrobiota bacterium]